MNAIALREYRVQAAELIESGQLQAALRVAQRILDSFPHALHGHCLLGRALLGLGRLEEAAYAFEQVLAADPENPEASLGLAIVHQKSGDRQRALEALQYAFDLFPADAALRERLNATAEALTAAQSSGAIELSRVALARIYARNGLRAKAIQELQAILNQQPQRHDVRLALAEALWQEGLHQEAAEESQRVLAALPNALKANWIMAALWLERSQPEAAQPYLARAQALDPEHEMAAALLGADGPVPLEYAMLIEPAGDLDWLSRLAVTDALGQDIADPTAVYEKEAVVMREPSPSEEPFEIPDWLKDLSGEILSEEPPAPEPPADAEIAGGAAPAALPDWLQALIARAETGSAEPVTTPEPEAELPPWLSELPPEETSVSVPPPVEAAPTLTTEELNWQSTTAQPAEEIPASDAAAELPEWLRQIQRGVSPASVERASQATERGRDETAADEVAPVETEELPEWLREIQRGVSPASVERASQATERAPAPLPEWLRDETAADEIAPVETEELPEWLRGEVEAAEPVPSAAPAPEELPDWLREIEEEKPVPPAEMPLPTPEAAQPELPTRLIEEVTAPEPAPPVEAPSTALPEAESPPPEWLQELRAAVPEHEPAPAEATAEEEAPIPEWLRQLRAGTVEEPKLNTSELEEDLAKISIVVPSEVDAVGAPPVISLVPEQPLEEALTADVGISAPVSESPAEASTTAAAVEEVATLPGVEEAPSAAAPVAKAVEEAAAPSLEEVAATPGVEEAPSAAATVTETVTALPETPAERLALARKMALADQWTQALSLYAALVDAAELLDSVISDLEEGIRRHPDDYYGYQLVGDAYARGGRLAEALRAYRIALVKLQQQAAQYAG